MKTTKTATKTPPNPFKNKFTADFETTRETDKNGITKVVRVWAWGINGIEDPDFFEYGTDIDDFMAYVEGMGNVSLYFHNLKYDGGYLIDYLLKRGFIWVSEKASEELYPDGCFSTTISDMGMFYKIRICFSVQSKKKHFVEIYDSLKMLPFSVAEVAEAFDLPIKKLKMDYDLYRPLNHVPTPEEVDYLRNDVCVMSLALHSLFEQGLTKMTQASNALFDYKRIIGDKNFERWFPKVASIDADIRKAYRGGFTYLNPKYANKNVGSGLVLDVNSLYPWAMYECLLPYGDPVYYEGEYKSDRLYPVYIQQIKCRFKLKKDHIPTIQLKNSSRFVGTEYLTRSATCYRNRETGEWYVEDEPVLLTLTSVDLKLFFDHYDVYDVEYLGGYKFKAQVGMFKEYIDKWMNVKMQATIDGNKALRTISKLMLNALYGKFGTSIYISNKIPYLENGQVKYVETDPERKPDRSILYIPIACFITAYAREKTIRSAQKVYDKFIYADTDSLHMDIDLPDIIRAKTDKETENMTTEDFINAGISFPSDFIINPVNLGAWKAESRFFRARFIRAKTYIEDSNKEDLWNKAEFNSSEVKEYCEDNLLDFKEEIKKYSGMYDKAKLKITCAGMPKGCYKNVSWDNFYPGASFEGKLAQKTVPGGVVLEETIFTIKP